MARTASPCMSVINSFKNRHLALFTPFCHTSLGSHPSARLPFSHTALANVVKPLRRPPVYRWHEGVEDLEHYFEGGYHPVHIGERFQSGRYEVVHKLGFGSYSTVWLARDHKLSKFVAVKILRSDASRDNAECSILDRLASGSQMHIGRRSVINLVDQFCIKGPNGKHQCIVTDAAGFSVAQSKECSLTWKFPAKSARAMVAQLIQGLSYVHSQGLVHGDLHANNILVKAKCFAVPTTESLYDLIGQPQRLPSERVDGQAIGPEVPRYSVPPATIVQCAEDVVDPDIAIADFGEAFLCEDGSTVDVSLRTPTLLLPPESIFAEGIGPAADIWTAACTIYDVLGERPLFEGFAPSEDHVVAEMISTLGPLPRRWWEKWAARSEYFLEDGSWKQDTTRPHAPYSRPLSERLRIMGRSNGAETDEFTPRELGVLEDLLRGMLAYEPEQRLSAHAAGSEPWMLEFGLEELEPRQ